MRSGASKELVSAGAVEAGPGACTFDLRHMYTAKGTEWPTVRAVSYNILADVYAQTDLSKTVLYPYCAPYALQLDYRQNLIKKELAGYNADIICLQEVDKGRRGCRLVQEMCVVRPASARVCLIKRGTCFRQACSPTVWLRRWTPLVWTASSGSKISSTRDWQHSTAGPTPEGFSAPFRPSNIPPCFHSRSRFRLLSRHDVALSAALTSDPAHSEILERLSTSGTLKERMLKRSTSLQVCAGMWLIQACIGPPSHGPGSTRRSKGT